MDQIKYRFESERLKTFMNWPCLFVKPEELAKNGFYYTQKWDKVKCFECNVEIFQWAENDIPEEEHRKWANDCNFVQNLPCGNVPIGVDPSTIPIPVRSNDVCGCYMPKNTKQAEYPAYDTYIKRLETFKNFPVNITKETFALAGFYYTGKKDQTLCYHCGVGLSDWDIKDDPWEKHAKWSEKCGYLINTKGQEYINNIIGIKTTEEADSRITQKNITNSNICKICYDRELNIVFLPCGHIIACETCSVKILTCSICRTRIEKIVKVYFS